MEVASNISPNAHLYMSEEGSDVALFVKTNMDTWRIPAHAVVLCKHSEVFSRMLTPGNFKEGKKREIYIEDIGPDIILLLLRYLYVGEMWADTLVDILNLLQASHKYQIYPLIQACERDAWRMLSPHTVCEVYNIAERLGLADLSEKCLDLILKAGVIVLESDGVVHLTRDCLEQVISKNTLAVDSEFKVLQMLWKWAKKECCRKGFPLTEDSIGGVLGDLLRHVRHDSIAPEQMNSLPPIVARLVKAFPSPEPRAPSCISEALLDYATTLWLSTRSDWMDTMYELGYSSNRSMVFSPERPLYLLAICLGMVSVRLPEFVISLERHDNPLKAICTLSSDSAKISSHYVDNKWKQIMEFRLCTPLRLDVGCVYTIFLDILCTDNSVSWPRFSVKGVVSDASGRLSITVQGNYVWAITEMLCIPAPHMHI